LAANGSPQPDPFLWRVERAVKWKARAEREYLAALQLARDAGYSAAQIAGPAGVTRQRVLQVTVPPRELPPPLDAAAPAWERIRRLRAEVGYD
jgi:hypothetical protein